MMSRGTLKILSAFFTPSALWCQCGPGEACRPCAIATSWRVGASPSGPESEQLFREAVQCHEARAQHFGFLEADAHQNNFSDELKIGLDHGTRKELQLDGLGQLGEALLVGVHSDEEAQG